MSGRIGMKPRSLRIIAWICWAYAAFLISTAVLTFLGEWLLNVAPPDFNRASQTLDGFVWAYVGMLHADLADHLPTTRPAAKERP